MMKNYKWKKKRKKMREIGLAEPLTQSLASYFKL